MALKWINTIAFAAMVAVNALANLLPIGGNTTGQVSQAYPNLFTPAPFTFAIWGVIYLLLALFVVYQWEVLDGGLHSDSIRRAIGPWFAISCVLNIMWIFLWHYDMIGLSAITMVLLLISLIEIARQASPAGGNFWQRMAAKAGFSLYFGWIIAATIANVSVLLTKLGWNGFGLPADFWTSAVLLIGAVIACAAVIFGKSKSPLVGIAVMWAYCGILVRHISPAYLGGAHPFVIAFAMLGEALILVTVLMPYAMPLLTKVRPCKAKGTVR